MARRDRKNKILSSNPCAPPALLCCECGIIHIVDARWGQVLGRARHEPPYLLRSIILSSAPVLLTHDQMDKGVAERDWSRRKEHRQKVEQRHGMRKGKVLVRTLCHHWLIRNRQGT